MSKVSLWFKSGAPWVWMTAGAVSISLLAVLGLLLLIASRGLTYFWPEPLHQFLLEKPHQPSMTLIGEIYDREEVLANRLYPNVTDNNHIIRRILVKLANREVGAPEFIWLNEADITQTTLPVDAIVIERETNGKAFGLVERLTVDGKLVTQDIETELRKQLLAYDAIREQISVLEGERIRSINHDLEALRLEERKASLDGVLTQNLISIFSHRRSFLVGEYSRLEKELFELRKVAKDSFLIIRTFPENIIEIPLKDIVSIQFPNRMSWQDKFVAFLSALSAFVSEEPRDSNTEGGVFPAIFGTVFMVLLMSILVTPLGVIAAIYLHEYAKNNLFTRLIRVAVINLAGVPSIVYGVFGLGFFVYVVGHNIDQLLYSESLPTPTFGTPGLLWSALTLALLTLPVVIVSTEEGLSRIPLTVREGSLALGATKAETLWRIVLPMASPAIMTGLILAVSRAAGEVAPLMLVGVVKMAPSLPVDSYFPFIHLERKFMHLGFHIYDVGFQSPNVESARPLVYASAFLLVSVIVALNITAIAVRNHLREKFRSFEQV